MSIQNSKRAFQRFSALSRGYQSLSIAVNQQRRTVDPQKSYTISKKDTLCDLQSLLSRVTTLEGLRLNAKQRLSSMKSWLGDYKLPDALLLCSIYPQRDHLITIRTNNDPSVNFNIDTKSLESLGWELFNLEKTKAALELSSTFSNDNLDIFDSDMYEKFQRVSTLNKYLIRRGFLRNVVISRRDREPIRAAQSSFFILIGLLAYKHGKPYATHFLDEKVFKGSKNMLEIAARA